MKHLTILVGPPGSGKTTMAKNMISDLRISQDDMGKEGHMRYFLQAIADGDDIVIDRLNFNKEQRQKYLAPAKANGYVIRIVVLHVDSKTCMSRMLMRQGHPTIQDEKAARSALHTFHSKYERPTSDEADDIEFHWPEGDKPFCIVSDIDNTLSDASHREHILNTPGQKKNWKGFFDAMGEDKLNDWCGDILNAMAWVPEQYRPKVILTSARPDNYRNITESWLLHHEVNYDELIMRARNDFRRDDIVKEQLYEFEIKTRYNVTFWIDDRKQVIDKIRSHGVTVLDCAGPKGDW